MNLPGDITAEWWIWRATNEETDYPAIASWLANANEHSERAKPSPPNPSAP